MEFDMSYLFFKDINREEFDEFVKNHEYCNLLQSYNWAKVKSNWDHMYTGVYKDNGFSVDKKIAIIILYVLFTQRSHYGL